MSSRLKRGGKGGGPKHVRLYEWMLRSAAWHDLSPVERQLYVEVKRKYDGLNNGRIALGCREAAEALRIGKGTASRAFRKLEANGFIVQMKAGGFNMKTRDGRTTEWLLTEYPCDVTGELARKTFMKWRPDEFLAVPFQTLTVPSQVPRPTERRAKHA